MWYSKNMTRYKILYRTLVTIHGLWVLAMLASVPLIVRYDWGYLPALTVSIATLGSWIIYGGCPLRIWENNLHAKYAPEKVYTDLFSQHYFNKFFNVRIPTPIVRTTMGGTMIAVLLISLG